MADERERIRLIGERPKAPIVKARCQVCGQPASIMGQLWQTASQRGIWIACTGKKGCGFNGEATYAVEEGRGQG